MKFRHLWSVAWLLFAASMMGIAFKPLDGWATFYKWSQTAASNATADATINWAEGMAPSAVNDSARAMMAATAKFRDDVSGKLVTAGGTTAFTLTSNQVFASLSVMDGAEVCFRMNATSGASPTLNVDTLGAKAINAVSGTAIASGALVSGGVYCAVYNNASSEWLVKGAPGATVAAPAGAAYISSNGTCPTGWTRGATHNDKALRLVTSGSPSSGGTSAFSTTFGQTVTGGTAISQANLPSVNFSATNNITTSFGFQPVQDGGANISVVVSGGTVPIRATSQTLPSTSSAGTDNSISVASGGSGTAHTHAFDTRVTFVDVVICAKD